MFVHESREGVRDIRFRRLSLPLHFFRYADRPVEVAIGAWLDLTVAKDNRQFSERTNP
jgi:hypothetical protein